MLIYFYAHNGYIYIVYIGVSILNLGGTYLSIYSISTAQSLYTQVPPLLSFSTTCKKKKNRIFFLWP